MDSQKDNKTVEKVGSEKPEEEIEAEVSDIPETDINAPLEIEQTNSFDGQDHQNTSNNKIFIIGILIGGVIILASGAFFFLGQGQESEPKIITPLKTPVSAPAEEEKTSFNRSKWSLEVLNGSGIAGVSKKAAEKLVQLGYQVVKTGNADKSNYQTTQVFVSNTLLDQADQLIKDLSDEFKSASMAGELKDSTASARIIIGKE